MGMVCGIMLMQTGDHELGREFVGGVLYICAESDLFVDGVSDCACWMDD